MMNKALTTVSVLVAGLASLCCIGHLMAVGLGLGTFGAAALFEGLRPYLLIVTGALLVVGFYVTSIFSSKDEPEGGGWMSGAPF